MTELPALSCFIVIMSSLHLACRHFIMVASSSFKQRENRNMKDKRQATSLDYAANNGGWVVSQLLVSQFNKSYQFK